MKFIILTYDQQIGLANLVVKKYSSLIRDSKVEYFIPSNSLISFEEHGDNIVIIQTQSDIISTMKSLLQGIDDDEWVYWAIDDRYPISGDFEFISKFIDVFNKDPCKDFGRKITAIKLTHWGETLSTDEFSLFDYDFYRQEPSGMFGFWHHQFIRSGLLKDIFYRLNPSNINNISLLNDYHNEVSSELFIDSYVPSKNIISMGEPLIQGMLTLNGVEELEKFGCTIPDYPIINEYAAFYSHDEQLCNQKNLKKTMPKFISKEDLDNC